MYVSVCTNTDYITKLTLWDMCLFQIGNLVQAMWCHLS